MNEVEKLYENAGIEPDIIDSCTLADKYWDDEDFADLYITFDNYMKKVCPHNQECTDECKNAYDRIKYPPFTAEKQLKLLCFLINFGVEITMQKCNIPIKLENIANNLTGITNEIWQDLTESEKTEIKRILEYE